VYYVCSDPPRCTLTTYTNTDLYSYKKRQHTGGGAMICEHGDHSYLLPSVCAGVSGAGR